MSIHERDSAAVRKEDVLDLVTPLARGRGPDRARRFLLGRQQIEVRCGSAAEAVTIVAGRVTAVTRYETSAIFSIREAWNGGLNICSNLLSPRAPKSNSVVDAFTLNNQTPKSWTARRIFSRSIIGLRCKCGAARKCKMRKVNIVGRARPHEFQPRRDDRCASISRTCRHTAVLLQRKTSRSPHLARASHALMPPGRL